MRPTKDQIKQARNYVAFDVESRRHDMSREAYDAYRVFLAATAEPTDEELEREAERLAHERKHVEPIRVSQFVHAYIAGARREGRK